MDPRVLQRPAPGCQAAARRTSPRRCSAVMFVAFILQIVVPLSLQLPGRLDVRADASSPGCGWCSGAPPSCVKESEEIRFDLIYGAVGAGARASAWRSCSAVAIVVLYGASLPAIVRLRQLHEGREDVLSQDPLRLAVLDLRGLPRRGHRALRLAPVAAAARQGSRGGRPDQGRAPACDARQFASRRRWRSSASACSGCRSATP